MTGEIKRRSERGRGVERLRRRGERGEGDEESEGCGGTREVMLAINRTGTQPVDSSGVTFARERGEERARERERERERKGGGHEGEPIT